MIKKISIIFSIVLLGLCTAKSQDMPVHEQYMFDWTLVNPSFIGLSESTIVRLTHREQWVGIENSPRTSVLSIKRKLNGKSGGLGGYLYTDRNGPSTKTGVQFGGSFQSMMRATRYQKLVISFGMSARLIMHTLDESNFEQHIYDPIINYSKQTTYTPNLKAGLLISFDKYFLGSSMDNLLQFTDRMYNTNIEPYPPLLLNVHAGAKIDFMQRMDFRPSVFYKSHFNGLNQLDINVKFQMYSGKEIRSVYIRYSNEFWVALSYKQTLDAGNTSPLSFSPSLGLTKDKITFAYLYDLGLTSLQLHHSGTHQISIGLKIFPDKYVNWGKQGTPSISDDF